MGRKEEVEHVDGSCCSSSGPVAYSYVPVISLSSRKKEYSVKLLLNEILSANLLFD